MGIKAISAVCRSPWAVTGGLCMAFIASIRKTTHGTGKKWFERCEDPRKRAICLAVLEEEDAPRILDGKAVAGGAYGGTYQ